MPKSYSVAEARSRLAAIVKQVEAGVEVQLTRRGKPVAVLISHRQRERLRNDRPQFIDTYLAFLQRHSLKRAGVDPAFFQSMRSRNVGRKRP